MLGYNLCSEMKFYPEMDGVYPKSSLGTPFRLSDFDPNKRILSF